MNRYATYLIFLLTMFPLHWANAADVPFIMNYQGSVKTAGGMPYNGNGYFKFAIVDLAGTTSYWSNDNTSAVGSEPTASVEIPVSSGLFSVKLGDVTITNMTTDLSGTVFDNTSIYIRTWFSDDGATFSQLSPDQQIVSTGHAIHAQQAENADTLDGNDSSAFVEHGQVTKYISITLWGMSKPLWNNFQGGWNSTAGLRYVSGTNTFDIPVYLPHGVRITEFRAYVYDADAGTIDLKLFGSRLNVQSLTELVSVSSSGTSGDQDIFNALSHNVDNSTLGYSIRVNYSGSTTVGISGIRITYIEDI